MKKKIYSFKSTVSVILIGFMLTILGCEKDNDTGNSGSFNDYKIEVEVKNSQTQIGVGGVRVKVGAKDTGLNSDVGDFGCKNLGTSSTDGYGKTSIVALNFAGEPEVCEVQVFDSNGSAVTVNDSYYNSQIRKLMVWIY